jgi:hypothetical protein
MNKIINTPCRKCGGDTSIRFIPSSGMDIEPTGMKRTCTRCGFYEFINSLDDDKNNKVLADSGEIKK